MVRAVLSFESDGAPEPSQWRDQAAALEWRQQCEFKM
jgi:hypothetical protein